MRNVFWIVLMGLALVLFGCESNNLNTENDSDNMPLMGTEGGPCYSNGLCDIGFECDQTTNLCVEAQPVCEDGDRMCSSFDNARHILICVSGFWESERDCYNEDNPTGYYCREGWDGELYCHESEIGIVWMVEYSSEQEEATGIHSRSIATDSSGNIYVAGYTHGHLLTNYEEDAVLIKFKPDGTISWVKYWGSQNIDENIYSIAVDKSDNVYLTGSIGEEINSGRCDMFLTKWNSDGEVQWTKQWGNHYYDYGTSVAIDNSGDVLAIKGSEYDTSLIKLNSDGVEQWSKEIDEGDFSVVTDSSNNIYVYGSVESNHENINFPQYDLFLAKWSADGTEEWIKEWNYFTWDIGSSIAIDSDDNVFTAGKTKKYKEIVGGHTYESQYAFLSKISRNGEEVWTKQFFSDDYDTEHFMAIDSLDNIFISGRTYLKKLNSQGEETRVDLLSRLGSCHIAIDNRDNIFLTGNKSSDQHEYIFLIKYFNETGNAGDSGDTGNTGNSGNTGDTGNTGNTGNNCPYENFPNHNNGDCWSVASYTMGHADAISYCEGLGGHLPSISELRTLIQNCSKTETGGSCGVTDSCCSYSNCVNDYCSGCSYSADGKYSVFGDTGYFWSSSVRSDNESSAWDVNFDGGIVSYDDRQNNNNIRCVK